MLLAGTDFSGADLEGASLMRPSIYTTLEKNSGEAPKFAGANLRNVRLTAMMDGADLTGADLDGAVLRGARGLDEAKGLNEVKNIDRTAR